MEIYIREDNVCIYISISGSIETRTLKDIKNKIFDIVQETTNKDIELDIRDIDYIDSLGVDFILKLNKTLNIHGKKLFLKLKEGKSYATLDFLSTVLNLDHCE